MSITAINSSSFYKCSITACASMSLCIGKIIIIPIELVLTAIVAITTALTTMISCSHTYRYEKPTAFSHMCGLLYEFINLILTTIKYQVVAKKGEELQKADGDPNSPEYIHIQPQNGSETNKNIIIYAPGLYDEPETLKKDCHRLAENTHCSVYAVKYHSRFQTIEKHAKDIDRVARAILQGPRANANVVLIGHSMGGLVTGTYIKKTTQKIKLWVTIASPLRGSPMAYAALLGKCAKQMRPNSTFIQNFKDQSLDNTPSLHIATRTDLLVPFNSARYDSKPVYVCKKPAGHLAVRSLDEVHEQIQLAIQRIV